MSERPTGAPELVAVIPAFNEAGSIRAVVEAASSHALAIVVDDGSSDATADVARAAGADVVSHPRNLGYDAALESGFARASALEARYVVTMDADGQHAPELLATFRERLDGGADVVIGIRPRNQRVAERLFASVAALCLGIRDPLCGMKGYRIEVYRGLGHFDSYGSIGTELSLHAASRGLHIEQVPVPMRERADAPRFGRTLHANLRIVRALVLALPVLCTPRAKSG